MTLSRLVRTIVVSFAGAAVLGQAAFAGGEPKNEPPFTRPATVRSTQAAAHPARHEPAIQGEAKNELPFTRPATVVVSNGAAGFDWAAGGVGAAVGIGLALAGTGAVLVARKSPQAA